MKARYRALLALMMSDVVSYVFASSGTAAKMAVDDMGARNAQYESIETMTAFRAGEKRSYCAASFSS